MQAISLNAPRPSPEFRFGLAKQERRNSRLRLIVLGPWGTTERKITSLSSSLRRPGGDVRGRAVTSGAVRFVLGLAAG